MKLQLVQEKGQFIIKENGRIIYYIERDEQDAMNHVILKNMYQVEILHFYHVKKWYHFIKPLRYHHFIIKDGNGIVGELRKNKKEFTLIYHDVFYHLFGGTHLAKQSIIVFDRKKQMAEFTLDEVSEVSFTYGIFGALNALLMYAFKELIKKDDFNYQAYLHHYEGLYLRTLDDVVTG